MSGQRLALARLARQAAPHSCTDPHDRALDTGVQITAALVVREEGIQPRQEAHGGDERSATRRRARGARRATLSYEIP